MLSESIGIKEVEDGLQLEFEYSAEIILESATFIKMEKGCCPFWGYSIFAWGKEETIKFALTGTEWTKNFIKY